jgi:uncharacterized membrane protein
MTKLLNYLYVVLTIGLTVYGQIIIKWRVDRLSALRPTNMGEAISRWVFYRDLLLDPLVLSGFVAAFVAALSWMAALTKFPLNHIYPMTSLSFLLVGLFSWHLFGEPMTVNKALGLALIVIGIVVASYK